MAEAVIVDVVRTPIGRGKPIVGDLSGVHAVKLLAESYRALLERNDVDAADVEQAYAGCVTQAGEQSNNLAKNAWLQLGQAYTAGCSTIDTQCGSAQTANHIMSALIAAGQCNIGIAGGVEAMSRVGLGASAINGPGYFMTDDWPYPDGAQSQFDAAERIAKNRGITRQDIDELAVRSHTRAIEGWDNGWFTQVVPVEAPVIGADGQPTGETKLVSRDQGMRETTMDSLANLRVLSEGGIHTAGTSSQVSDGSAAVLWMSADEAKARGLKPRARIIQGVVAGSDPYYLLDGPVNATELLFKKTGMNMNDIDIVEINEAFASVVLSWQRVFNADMDKVNCKGGAIAMGHPVGSTGARLIGEALIEMERQDKSTALITMCCGASNGTGTIIERL
ncbi:steroid 3-ketoacyl-CoA thiolase [Halieaceae bacterium IMCC14734]|uniref:Steroid 3-ketoacyl-CoA thiolase n=1 Tax=Candidatus Litorirhabdus singularis TaxID=2518993 RepID=A0ABT3TLJ5_9GAMM|nr:steroid 3-ketoacyl-CoA thiolase [Candidatus Litorirhabdus singularis]MCX2983168.1 steroid 3-ketoacyl-CoA thiolase [Candidatus Litorirhabdus singularis]